MVESPALIEFLQNPGVLLLLMFIGGGGVILLMAFNHPWLATTAFWAILAAGWAWFYSGHLVHL